MVRDRDRSDRRADRRREDGDRVMPEEDARRAHDDDGDLDGAEALAADARSDDRRRHAEDSEHDVEWLGPRPHASRRRRPRRRGSNPTTQATRTAKPTIGERSESRDVTLIIASPALLGTILLSVSPTVPGTRSTNNGASISSPNRRPIAVAVLHEEADGDPDQRNAGAVEADGQHGSEHTGVADGVAREVPAVDRASGEEGCEGAERHRAQWRRRTRSPWLAARESGARRLRTWCG